MAPDDDPKVKAVLAGEQVVDEATRRELERWFGLPSFQQLADEGKQAEEPPAEDPAIKAVREQRERAVACVDPALVARIEHRVEKNPETLLTFAARIEVRVDPDVAMLDLAMIERVHTVAEPREVERPDDIEDHLKDRAPQALLRDLHRPETDFTKSFEVIDYGAEQRVDAVAAVDTAMKTSWQLPPLGPTPGREGAALLAEVRAERSQSWPALFARLPLKYRKVSE